MAKHRVSTTSPPRTASAQNRHVLAPYGAAMADLTQGAKFHAAWGFRLRQASGTHTAVARERQPLRNGLRPLKSESFPRFNPICTQQLRPDVTRCF